MSARMSFHSCADGATAFGITLILAIASKQRSLAGACADMVRTASRILEGSMARRGLVETPDRHRIKVVIVGRGARHARPQTHWDRALS
jgi:hypothetical protein